LSAQSKNRIVVSILLLTAGSSSRFEGNNKLLAVWQGKPLIEHALNPIVASAADNITVITGHDHESITLEINRLSIKKPLQMHYNDAHRTGMASSISLGIASLAKSDAVIVCLADMPMIDSKIIDSLIESFNIFPDKAIHMPVYNGLRGNPVLISNILFDSIQRLKGDTGARVIAAAQPELVQEVAVQSDGIHQDIDTAKDLQRLP